jgi:hypothetical protein
MRAIATNGYAAKRAIIDRLAEVSRLGSSPGLARAKVSYNWGARGTTAMISVFGGLVTFAPRTGEGEELVDGDDVLAPETATVSLHIRVVIDPPPPGGLEDVEELVEQIADEIADEIARNRHIAGGHSFAKIIDGLGDEEPVGDGLAARLTMHIAVDSWLTPQT